MAKCSNPKCTCENCNCGDNCQCDGDTCRCPDCNCSDSKNKEEK